MTAAAPRPAVEPPTTPGCRRVVTVEAELGVPLLYRTATGYVLAADGKNAIAQAEIMEGAALALGGRAREGSGVIAGRVRVAMPPEFGSHWVAPRLASF